MSENEDFLFLSKYLQSAYLCQVSSLNITATLFCLLFYGGRSQGSEKLKEFPTVYGHNVVEL